MADCRVELRRVVGGRAEVGRAEVGREVLELSMTEKLVHMDFSCLLLHLSQLLTSEVR